MDTQRNGGRKIRAEGLVQWATFGGCADGKEVLRLADVIHVNAPSEGRG